uniref:WAK_assoc domain-containing protein n=1 Tax=Strongyloides stercoralis TaxID=6248 RepID=A0A0K0EBE7_STRER
MKVNYFLLIYFLCKIYLMEMCIRAQVDDDDNNVSTTRSFLSSSTRSSTRSSATGVSKSTTRRPFCRNVKGRARLYIDPSATGPSVTNPIFGTKAGIECPLCGNTRYFSSAQSDVFDGSDTSGAINTYQCPVDQKLCLCDENFECFEEDNPTVGTTLYPYCTTPTSCFVYSILSAQSDANGVFPLGGGKGWTPANTTTPNFTFKSVRSGVFEKVSAISCNGCPVNLSDRTCLPEEPIF